MSTRRFFYCAISTALFVVVLHIIALNHFSHSIHHRARAVTLGESERAVARVKAGSYSAQGRMTMYAGLALALASIPLVIASARKKEPARRDAVFLLWVCYVLLQFLLV